MINIAFASRHVLLKSWYFWHMHLFFCDTRIKSEGTNHQHFLWKNDDYSKTEKENKNRRHGFRGKLSDNKLAKFQLNRFRGCRLGVENVRLTFRNFRSEKTRKINFLRHLTHNRIVTPNRPCWCLPERDHLAITIGVLHVICSRPNLYTGCGRNTQSLYFTVRWGYKSLLSEVS